MQEGGGSVITTVLLVLIGFALGQVTLALAWPFIERFLDWWYDKWG